MADRLWTVNRLYHSATQAVKRVFLHKRLILTFSRLNGKMKIVGFHGPIGSGKSTAANFFVDHGFTKFSFAAPLKKAVIEIFGFTEDQVYNTKHIIDDYWGVRPREVLQIVGTELFRNELPKYFPHISSIWVQTMDRKISENPDAKIVIDDVRFPDEVDLIHRWGGIVVQIESQQENRKNHESEQSLSTVDVIIRNDYTPNFYLNLQEFLD